MAGLALGLGLACGCTPKQAEEPTTLSSSSELSSEDVVGWKINLSEDAQVVPALVEGARRAGCDAREQKPDQMVAVCPGAALAVVQQGRQVLVGCQKVSLDDCRTVFSRILEATPIRAD